MALPDPPRLARRRIDGAEGRVARDRLASMLMLAALLHGLLLLGISFAPPGDDKGAANQGIEVLLVSEELPQARRNDTATYLSQRTQTGSGNTSERVAAQLPTEAQPATSAAAAAAQPGESLDEQLLATTDERSPTHVLTLPAPATEELSAADSGDLRRQGDDTLVLRGKQRDELYVTADTRASRLAPYLDGWRRRVERVGTINYPSVAQRQGMTGNPVVEVALLRDGRLQTVRIQRSSGHPEIDAAALDILRLASPFDPFPPDLARDYRVLHFAYEWQFVGGRIRETAISVP
jgi:protein TonB